MGKGRKRRKYDRSKVVPRTVDVESDSESSLISEARSIISSSEGCEDLSEDDAQPAASSSQSKRPRQGVVPQHRQNHGENSPEGEGSLNFSHEMTQQEEPADEENESGGNADDGPAICHLEGNEMHKQADAAVENVPAHFEDIPIQEMDADWSDEEFADAMDFYSDSEGIEEDDSEDEYQLHDQSGSESGGQSDDEADSDSEAALDDVSSDEDVQVLPPDGDQPLYEGAPITLHESLLAIFSLASSEHLSGQLLLRILQLVALHCPVNNLCKKTLHQFKKYFKNMGPFSLIYHYFCSDCVYPLRSKESQCTKCQKAGNVSYFIEIPLFHQLQAIFKRPRFYDHLQYRFDANRKKNEANIEDIYDGRVYQDEMRDGFLRNPNNISFMWWSDGLQIFKSAIVSSIWPVCLVINELCYEKRILPKNILLAGLWMGKKQPNPNLFLKPLSRSMKIFSQSGYNFKLHDNTNIVVKAKILLGTCDLPAKAKFMCCKQFNGEYGCSRCLHPGQSIRLAKSSIRAYPNLNNVELRTHEQTQQHARAALNLRQLGNGNASVCGVKGPSILSNLVPDIIRCTAIDIMHGAFLGVCKLLILLWFEPRFSDCPWSLAHSVDLIDEKIRTLKPPSFVQRPLRSIKHALAFWKAAEYKLFLLYYSIPVLMPFMSNDYFKHHCKLVSALSLLLQDSISVAQITAASALLNQYVSDFAGKYGLRFLGMNVHQLVHLSDVVFDLGPLWVYSCFFLESFNGTIVNLFHGTRHVATQICSSVTLFMEVPVMIEALPDDSVVKQFCLKITYKKESCKIADQITNKMFAVGTYCDNRDAVVRSRELLRTVIGDDITGQVKIFHRLKKDGTMYFSLEYSRSGGRKESSFVNFYVNDTPCLGRVLRYVKWRHCTPLCAPTCDDDDCEVRFYAIVREYSRELWYPHDNPEIRLPHLFKVKMTNIIKAIPVDSLVSLLYYVKVDENEYLAKPLNSVEVE